MTALRGATLALALMATATSGAQPKKLIYFGWGTPDTAWVAAHAEEAAAAPFDGTAISIAIDRAGWRAGRTDTNNQLGWKLFGPRLFRVHAFSEAITDLRTRGRLECFLPASISSEGQDEGFSWFDERRWKVILKNWHVLVTIAREGGCRGVVLDPEHYRAQFFSYPAMAARAPGSFDDHRGQVRRRGRQLMAVTRPVFPDLTILAVFGYSLAQRINASGDLATGEYGLYPSFLDGMLEAAAPGFRLVDGYEFAYAFKQRRQFEDGRKVIKEGARALTAVPDRYRDTVEAGFGLWIDYNSGRQGWDTATFRRNHFTPAELREALGYALAVSDGYVWLYSETPGFFPPQELPPAYFEAIDAARRFH